MISTKNFYDILYKYQYTYQYIRLIDTFDYEKII